MIRQHEVYIGCRYTKYKPWDCWFFFHPKSNNKIKIDAENKDK